MNRTKENGGAAVMTMPSDTKAVMSRVFDAPRELVFQVFTDPKHIQHWWGPRRYTTIVDRLDLRPGGVWRFLNRDANGKQYAFNGAYREITRPERLVYTFEYEGMPGHVTFETVTFREEKGKTKVTVTSLFETAEDMKEMLKSGMETGAKESWDRLAELLESMQ